MNLSEHLLVCLIEEIKEVEKEIEQTPLNINKFKQEINDLIGVATLINKETIIDFEQKFSPQSSSII